MRKLIAAASTLVVSAMFLVAPAASAEAAPKTAACSFCWPTAR